MRGGTDDLMRWAIGLAAGAAGTLRKVVHRARINSFESIQLRLPRRPGIEVFTPILY